jgi:hypothetical protein
MYGVHKVQISLHGCFMSEGTLVQNYGTTNGAPTQQDQPLLSLKGRPHFQTHTHGFGTNKNLAVGPRCITLGMDHIKKHCF